MKSVLIPLGDALILVALSVVTMWLDVSAYHGVGLPWMLAAGASTLVWLVYLYGWAMRNAAWNLR